VDLHSENLADVIARHQIELPEAQIALMGQYCEMLWQWNEKINLTRHTTYEKFVTRDLVDSLVFAEFLGPNEKILDVGSGGGVPGVLLAIIRPDLNVSLADSVGKKAKVLTDIVQRLDLNVPVFHARAEELLKEHKFDTLTIRAVAPLKKLLQWFQPCRKSFDRLLILKGPAWIEERKEARHFGLMKDIALRKLKTYPLPGTDSESVLLQISSLDRM
jgi:16S rRNA (guanine527-N7)-methyltransferase